MYKLDERHKFISSTFLKYVPLAASYQSYEVLKTLVVVLIIPFTFAKRIPHFLISEKKYITEYSHVSSTPIVDTYVKY